MMIKKITNISLIYLYDWALRLCGFFIPKKILGDSDVDKNDLSFKIYIFILQIYIIVRKKIYGRGYFFITELQKKRLRDIIKISEKKSLWWKEYFKKNKITKTSNLTIIPPVSRENFINTQKKEILTCDEDDHRLVIRRSGGTSTGVPLVWGHNKSTIILNSLAPFIENLKLDNSFLNKKNFFVQFNFPHLPTVSPFRCFFLADIKLKSNDPLFSTKLKNVVEKIWENKEIVLRTNPTELHLLTKELELYNLHPTIKHCLIVGQAIDEDERKFSSKYLNCQITAHYGSQETGAIGIECQDNHLKYHILSERVIIEILNKEGNTEENGNYGAITVTTLDNTFMPLIRYQIGDIGIIHTNFHCSCEIKTPLLEITSRITDVIKFSDKTEKSAVPALRLFHKEPFTSKIRRFQVIQNKLDEITIFLEERTNIDREDEEKILNNIKESYLGKLRVEIKKVSRIEHGDLKYKVFIPLKN